MVVATPIIITLPPVLDPMELSLLPIHLTLVLEMDRPPGLHFTVLILAILEISTIHHMYLSL